jgi:prefoldin subunit 5
MSNHKAEIKSLEHTIECHRSYIQELKTKHYRGAVTDDRIETMNNQIRECETTIERLKKGGL